MEEWLRIRLVYIDYYYDNPRATASFSCKDGTRQPVIRIFGSTLSGQKCCLHVHNVLPYFYVQLPHKQYGEAEAFSKQLLEFLEHSFSNYEGQSTQKVIAGSELVQKIPIYGFHASSYFFVKIYTYAPANIRKLADLCFLFPTQQLLQPYESHISYLSQFMIDYNLYGMNFIRIANPRFRLPLPLSDKFRWKENEIPWRRLSYTTNEETTMSFGNHIGKREDKTDIGLLGVPQRIFLSEHCEQLSHCHCLSTLERRSHCDLELDVNAEDILNPEDCKKIPFLKDASDEDRLVPSLRGLWEEDERRRRILGMESYSDANESIDRCKVNLSYSQVHLREAFLQRLKQEQKEFCLQESTDGSVVTTKRKGNKETNTQCNESNAIVAEYLSGFEGETKQANNEIVSDATLEEDDNPTESLWNDILQSSQLLERDINQEISQDWKFHPNNDYSATEMTNWQETTCISSQNVEDAANVVKTEDMSLSETNPSGSIQGTESLNRAANDGLETKYEVSTCATNSAQELSDTGTGNDSYSNQQRRDDGIIWITPRNCSPTTEDLNRMKKPIYKHVPQVTMDSYGRLNTRIVTNAYSSCSDETSTTNATSFLQTDDISSSEDTSHLSESQTIRPSSPRYDEMDAITVVPAQSQDSGQPKSIMDRRSLRLSDSSFFSPGFVIDADSNMSTRRESLMDHHSPKDEQLLPHQSQGLTWMSLELITKARKGKLPDPAIDAVVVVCLVICDERAKLHLGSTYRDIFHVILWLEEPILTSLHLNPIANDVSLQLVSNEEELFYKVAHWIRYYDVDMIFGYDIHRFSLGYLIERGYHLGFDFMKWISRWKETEENIRGSDQVDEEEQEDIADQRTFPTLEASRADAYMKKLGCHIKITGRYVFSIWNILRIQVKLPYYDYQGTAAMILKKRIPVYEPYILGLFLQDPLQIHVAYEYCLQKAADNLHFLEELDWISQTSELARIFGIDFRSVVTRGSQFRVESMLARLAHANGYLLLSCSREQLLNQPAMECLPLVMEPVTDFYQDPVIVMDFQSLYPSIIIAHNLCFCTMFGKVDHPSHRLGVVESYEPPRLVSLTNNKECSAQQLYERCIDDYYVAPNGECFVTSKIRKGILPRLLQEILSTRLMIKSSMKWIAEHYQGEYKDRLWKILNAQQFALKLIANVTYGYTSAAFSGRMPCSGLADAIVQHGRQAMKRSINLIEKEWQHVQARVVYGDTDSLFVSVPQVTWQQAWKTGKEMIQHISRQFPFPMRLVLEKVYQPCILLVKKRYVGYAYESLEQQNPILDAKGIETIRRDSCAAVQKLVERSLRLLFETRNVSRVKQYLLKKWSHMHRGNVHWMDFIFYMEVRWGTYRAQMDASCNALLPPAAVVASRRVFHDPRAVPLYGERIPFLIAYWMEKPKTLQDCVCSPEEFLSAQEKGHAVLHVTYYITKQMIPALQRFLGCLAIDVNQWYQQMRRPSTLLSWLMMPRSKNSITSRQDKNNHNTSTDCSNTHYPIGGLYHYYHYYICSVCGQSLYNPREWPLCPSCKNHLSWSSFILLQRWSRQQRRLKRIQSVCNYCSRHETRQQWHCQNFHCPIFFQRYRCQQWNEAYQDIINCLSW